MKTICTTIILALFLGFARWFMVTQCNAIVEKDAIYEGHVGTWQKTPSGEFVFVDDLGPVVVVDELPKRTSDRQ
jgi:hypothetical protein